jgi:hypothetical protein
MRRTPWPPSRVASSCSPTRRRRTSTTTAIRSSLASVLGSPLHLSTYIQLASQARGACTCLAGTSAYHYCDPAVFYLRLHGAKTAAMLYSDSEFTSSVAQGALNTLAAAGSDLDASSILTFKEVWPLPPLSPAMIQRSFIFCRRVQGTLNDTVAMELMKVVKNQDPDMFFAFLLLRDAAVRPTYYDELWPLARTLT